MSLDLSLGIVLGGSASHIVSPRIFPGLIAWWRSDLGVSQASNVMSAWADQSASGFVLNARSTTNFAGYSANGGPQGLPSVTFSGTHSIGNGSLNMGGIRTSCTIFGCLAYTTGSQTSYGCYSNTNDPPIFLANGGTRDFRFPFDLTGGATSTNFEFWVGLCQSGAQAFRVNGSQMSSGTNTITNSAATVFYLGASSAGANAMTGAWCELGYFNRVLTTGEVTQLETYARSRYKLW